jgi:hypothetical protein
MNLAFTALFSPRRDPLHSTETPPMQSALIDPGGVPAPSPSAVVIAVIRLLTEADRRGELRSSKPVFPPATCNEGGYIGRCGGIWCRPCLLG